MCCSSIVLRGVYWMEPTLSADVFDLFVAFSDRFSHGTHRIGQFPTGVALSSTKSVLRSFFWEFFEFQKSQMSNFGWNLTCAEMQKYALVC